MIYHIMITFKGIIYVNLGAKFIKLLVENIGQYLRNFGFGKGFLSKT